MGPGVAKVNGRRFSNFAFKLTGARLFFAKNRFGFHFLVLNFRFFEPPTSAFREGFEACPIFSCVARRLYILPKQTFLIPMFPAALRTTENENRAQVPRNRLQTRDQLSSSREYGRTHNDEVPAHARVRRRFFSSSASSAPRRRTIGLSSGFWTSVANWDDDQEERHELSLRRTLFESMAEMERIDQRNLQRARAESFDSAPYVNMRRKASHRERSKLPTIRYGSTMSYKQQTQAPKCVVCQGKLYKTSRVKILACEHIFHAHCIDQSLCRHGNECPICRRPAFA